MAIIRAVIWVRGARAVLKWEALCDSVLGRKGPRRARACKEVTRKRSRVALVEGLDGLYKFVATLHCSVWAVLLRASVPPCLATPYLGSVDDLSRFVRASSTEPQLPAYRT